MLSKFNLGGIQLSLGCSQVILDIFNVTMVAEFHTLETSNITINITKATQDTPNSFWGFPSLFLETPKIPTVTYSCYQI